MSSFRRSLFILASLLISILALAPGRVAQAHSVVQARAQSQLAPYFADVRVSRDTYAAHSEPSIAENPANPQNLVAASKFFTDPSTYRFKIGTFYSTDGGRTWHDNGFLPGFEQYSIVSDVSLAFSPNGSIVYAAVLACSPDDCLHHLSASGIFVSRSRDGGKTWSKPTTVFLDTTSATFSDKPWIAVDRTHTASRGTVYVAWNLDSNSAAGRVDPGNHLMPEQATNVPLPGMVVARSTDYGHTFSSPVNVMTFDQNNDGLGAQPAVGPDGRLSIAFMTFHYSANSTTTSLAITTSVDRGQTFTPLHAIAADIHALPEHLPNSNFRNISLPTFTISPSTGSMLITWADERYGEADILASRSTNGGRAWSAPVKVNDDPRGDGKDHFQPALAVAPNGAYTISWFDRRRDPGNRLIDVYVAQSTNDGASFGRNVRVTKKSWDPAIDAPLADGDPTNTFIGDYQALAVDNQTVHPLWNDTQNGTSQEIRTATLPIRLFLR